MATLVATRHNPVIRDFYQCLVTRGKLKKVALTACIRKLGDFLKRIYPTLALPLQRRGNRISDLPPL